MPQHLNAEQSMELVKDIQSALAVFNLNNLSGVAALVGICLGLLENNRMSLDAAAEFMKNHIDKTVEDIKEHRYG